MAQTSIAAFLSFGTYCGTLPRHTPPAAPFGSPLPLSPLFLSYFSPIAFFMRCYFPWSGEAILHGTRLGGGKDNLSSPKKDDEGSLPPPREPPPRPLPWRVVPQCVLGPRAVRHQQHLHLLRWVDECRLLGQGVPGGTSLARRPHGHRHGARPQHRVFEPRRVRPRDGPLYVRRGVGGDLVPTPVVPVAVQLPRAVHVHGRDGDGGRVRVLQLGRGHALWPVKL